MDYFNDDDYTRRSPGLDPVHPSLGYATPPIFRSLWLSQDIDNSPQKLAPAIIEYSGEGREARRHLYGQYATLTSPNTQFEDTLLLHHLSPNHPDIALALNTCRGTGDAYDNNADDWLYPSRYDNSPFRFKSIPKPSRSRTRGSKKTRLGLPITLNQKGTAATVLACADTGADSNIMSKDLAKILGYNEYKALSEPKHFVLANGKIVEAIGQITSSCSFGIDTEISVPMSCVFYVLLKVVTPIIMGMQFLEETETMTKHRGRLVRVPRPALQALSVCSVDKPRQLLSCSLDRKPTTATPDTGSEVDLISPQVATELGMFIHPGEEEVLELADGTIIVTTGYVRASVSIRNNFSDVGKEPGSISTTVEFYVLPELTHRILVGEETLEMLKVFTEYKHSLVPAFTYDESLGLNVIRHIGTLDRLLAKVKTKLPLKQSTQAIQGGEADMKDHLDQRENNRREREAHRISALPLDKQHAETDAELAVQNLYNNFPQSKSFAKGPSIPVDPDSLRNRESSPFLRSSQHIFRSPWRRSQSPALQSLASNNIPIVPNGPDFSQIDHNLSNTFRCLYSGCDALPFQTQYLLNSHKNVHGQDRPHYCPVVGCVRSEGGKGFKRKNEMIRHGILHLSPGYVCPFCPDREHKYPRPDNLQRHVRVHHTDKARDDPKLRDVLAQRPEGGSRGRRWRIFGRDH